MKKIIKKSILLALFSCLIINFISCSDDDNKSSLKFNPSNVTIGVGKTTTVTASGGTEPYTATSSDSTVTSIKIVKSAISITGSKKGKVTITVKDKNNTRGTILVTVQDSTDNQLQFDKKSIGLTVNNTANVVIKNGVSPYTATSKDSKTASVTVKNNIITIKGVKAGATTISVTDKDKKNNGTISVTIK